jgi:hypothetical protein
MTTDQKYDGKADNANPNEQTAQTDLQTVKNEDTSTAPPDPGARPGEELFTFADLHLFSSLCDSDKALLSGLHAKGFGRSQLVEASRHMAKTPSDSSPFDEYEGKSLSGILSSPVPKKFAPTQADLSGSLSLSVNARYGNSRVAVLLYALSEYQAHRLKTAFNEIQNGECHNGYTAFQDSEEAASAILEIGLELGALADKNYWASHGEAAKTTDHDRARFEMFMRDYVGRDATSKD